MKLNMRPHFIDTVANWVLMQYNAQNYLEKVGKVFGEDYMKLSSRLTTVYNMCFEDFLVFEYKPVFFYYKTGLEYFVEFNPQNLDKEIIAEYKEILETQVACVFELKRLVPGIGLELWSSSTGEIFVYTDDTFEAYEPGQLLWARVGKVNSKYYFVNEYVPPLWPVMGVSKLQITRSLSVQQVALISFADNEEVNKKQREQNKLLAKLATESFVEFQKIEAAVLQGVKETKNVFTKTKELFEMVRKDLNIDHLFSLETFNKWIDKTGDDNIDFAFRSLLFFVPEDFLENTNLHERYIEVGQAYINAYLTQKQIEKSLKNLNRSGLDKVKDGENFKFEAMDDISLEIDGKEIKGKFMTKTYSWREYQDLQFAGHSFLKDGKLKESKESYIKLAEKLLRDQTLFWPYFRVLANASSTYFMLGEFFMALGLVEAALRLNPKYKFAKMLKKNYLDAINSKKVSTELLDMFYPKSVFAEYENFLISHNVNLNKEVEHKVKQYKIN
jgi:tetratricopeptide (TPR) repeat protein